MKFIGRDYTEPDHSPKGSDETIIQIAVLGSMFSRKIVGVLVKI